MRIVLFLFISIVFGACCKDPMVVTGDTDKCGPEVYDRWTREYVNPYRGTLETGFVGSLQPVFLEQYSLYRPTVNPANLYEICYMKHKNDLSTGGYMQLYKFDFCTGENTLITNDVYFFQVDWSVKDWIIFTGIGKDLWKIKSNGDSLTRLTNAGGALQYDAKWNSDGTLFKWNTKEVADENGVVKYTLPSNIGFIVDWYDESHVLNVVLNAKEVTKYDVINKTSEFFAPMDEGVYIHFDKLRNEFIAVDIDHNTGFSRNFIYNMTTSSKHYLSEDFQPLSFESLPNSFVGDKVLVQQVLKDTMTGSPVKLNFRSHIALLSRDRKVRKVLLPQ